MNSLGFKQYVEDATHRSGHILDLVFTKILDTTVEYVRSSDHGFTDHFPVFIGINSAKPKPPKEKVVYRNWKSVNNHELTKCITQRQLSNQVNPSIQQIR